MKNFLMALLVIAAVTVSVLLSRTKEAVDEVVAPNIDLSNQPLPQTCTDQPEGTPVITSLSAYSFTSTGNFTINGCNFNGFEGDKDVWIMNESGVKGYLQGDQSSTYKLISLTLQSKLCQQNTSNSGLPCTSWLEIVPGMYKLYTEPWGKQSNEVLFEITQSL